MAIGLYPCSRVPGNVVHVLLHLQYTAVLSSLEMSLPNSRNLWPGRKQEMARVRIKLVVLSGLTIGFLWMVYSLWPDPWEYRSFNVGGKPISLHQLKTIQPPFIEQNFPKKEQRIGFPEDIQDPNVVSSNEVGGSIDISNSKSGDIYFEGQRTKRGNLNSNSKGFTDDSLRVFHLDLKGAPPKLQYLRRLLTFLAAHGCDSILIEYEDMFPYYDNLVNISAKNAYKRQEIRKMLSWAHDLGMEVIPLVQTFGHLEHVLKLNEWKHLRELSNFPSDLCPSRSRSIQLIEDMLSQVVSLHQGIKYIHIGGDEVTHIGACSTCTKLNQWILYSNHMSEVAQLLQRKYPGITPIIWDDMLRRWNPEFLSNSPLAKLVELMVWDYGDVNNLITPFLWHWYNKCFKRIWVASAFKGADLPTADLPDLQARYKNTNAWLKKVGYADVPIAGFVLTGWSRYDHFAVLCELLPTSVPSLLLNLIAISRKHVYLPDENKLSVWRDALSCPLPSFNLEKIKKDQNILATCNFPGVEVYGIVLHYLILKAKTDTLYDTMTKNKAWLTPYNIKHNFTNGWRIVQDYTYLKTYPLSLDVKKFIKLNTPVLLKYFDNFVINEWVEQKIAPLDEKLEGLGDSVGKLLNASTWPRRPLV